MKKISTIIFLFINSLVIRAQATSSLNLVPNGGFEDTIACPPTNSQLGYAVGWISQHGTPDLFSTCNNDVQVNVPNNFAAVRLPYEGNNYAGVFTFSKGNFPNFWSETFFIRLKTPLTIGQKYFFSMKVSLADSCNCATNNLGMYLTKDSSNYISNPNSNDYPNYAKIKATNKILSSAWTNLSGKFISDSAYKFLHVGNYFNNYNTDTIITTNFIGVNMGNYSFPISACLSYYLIDDIRLSTDSVYVVTSIQDLKNLKTQPDFIIYPNPVIDVFSLKFSSEEKRKICLISSISSEVVYEETTLSKTKEIPTKHLPNGLYFLIVKRENSTTTKKIIINH
ncbi:MAG: T9SS type A sorting domain-containing protein [Bacteroidia bacterium]|nr:T9SS type A sorting domain-containing protein [Bacteroidia bacterium]